MLMQRKKLARQAKYKKNGSKSKKCTLRQDHMTDAQLKKMNGEIVSFNMSRPIRSWKDFRGISKESAREYIDSLNRRYDVSLGDLAKMFGVSYNTVKKYLEAIEAPMPAGRMAREMVEAWESFLHEPEEEPCEEEEVLPDPAPVQDDMSEQVQEETIREMRMSELSLSFTGDLDYSGIFNSLRRVLGDAPHGTLCVKFWAPEG